MGKLVSLSLKKKRAAAIYISIKPFKVKFHTSRQTNVDLLTIDSPEDIKCAPIINSLALKQIIIYHNMYPDSGLIAVSFPRKTSQHIRFKIRFLVNPKHIIYLQEIFGEGMQ